MDHESFELQLRQLTPAAALESEPAIALYDVSSRYQAVPGFYLLSRSADGETRFDHVEAAVRPCFGTHSPAATGLDGRPCVRFDSGALSHWSSTGVHQFVAFRAFARPEGIVLHRSNSLEITVLEPQMLARTWGPRVAGLAVALDLDKHTYGVGEDIPLHIALQNFGAGAPVHTWSPVWDPGVATSLTVLDAEGVPLPRYGACFNIYSGHGRGPTMSVIPGEPVYVEDSCRPGFAQPALQPGSYTLVVTWTSLIGASSIPVQVQARQPVEIVP